MRHSDGHERGLMQPVTSVFPHLTPRETSLLRCLGKGITNKETATALALSEATARTYVGELISERASIRHQLVIIGFIRFEPVSVASILNTEPVLRGDESLNVGGPNAQA
jgi:DNA-binding CsgD family transcriptional regulator